MAKDSLFKIISVNADDSTIIASVEVDIDNEILKGHFPDQPVVPGACMVQMVKEVLADVLHQPLRLTKADNIKFLSLIEPSAKSLQLNISYQLLDNDIKVSAALQSGDITFMKLQGVFVSVSI
jgi:3-hydroxyacyl-[acyl-carrier-protein] dehydratase